MKYRFELDQLIAKKGKLPREERNDIANYISSVVIEAEEEKKACRLLCAKINGRLSRESTEKQAMITLPDYQNCQLVVRAVRQ